MYRLKRDIGNGEGECEWIDLVSEGRLKRPSQVFIDYLQLHYDIFIRYFKKGMPDILNILKLMANCCDEILAFEETVQSLSDIKFRNRIKDMYFKCLTRSMVRDLNEKIAQEKADKFNSNKIKQILNYIRCIILDFPLKIEQLRIIQQGRPFIINTLMIFIILTQINHFVEMICVSESGKLH